MISVSQAESLILSTVSELHSKHCPTSISVGEVLQESVVADRDFPPFDRVAMDGIAIMFDSWVSGQRIFVIQATQKAGDPPTDLTNPNHCIAVSTGASLPKGCTCIVKIEDTHCTETSATIQETAQLVLNQNIHTRGSDYPKNTALLHPGTVITAADTGILASVGKSTVRVSKRPEIAVIATGNELVSIDSLPTDFQIRSSNTTVIQSALYSMGFQLPDYIHLKDDFTQIVDGIGQALETHEVLILSGGVSAGNFDFVPKALKANGVEPLFHKIKQRPGKPMWFGRKGNKVVFGLPGNPVSVAICLYRYILPFLSRQLGQNGSFSESIQLGEDIQFMPTMTLFSPIRLKNSKGVLTGFPIKFNGSGDLASLSKADGFIECEESLTLFEKGKVVNFYKWTN